MPDEVIRLLLDQNVPQALSGWLQRKLPDWEIQHVNDLGFQGRTDDFLYLWSQKTLHSFNKLKPFHRGETYLPGQT